MPPQNKSLWQKDYFRLIIFKKLQTQEKLRKHESVILFLHVYAWLSPFGVHLKLSQHCMLIVYIPIQNKKLKRTAYSFFLFLLRAFIVAQTKKNLPKTQAT